MQNALLIDDTAYIEFSDLPLNIKGRLLQLGNIWPSFLHSAAMKMKPCSGNVWYGLKSKKMILSLYESFECHASKKRWGNYTVSQ